MTVRWMSNPLIVHGVVSGAAVTVVAGVAAVTATTGGEVTDREVVVTCVVSVGALLAMAGNLLWLYLTAGGKP